MRTQGAEWNPEHVSPYQVLSLNTGEATTVASWQSVLSGLLEGWRFAQGKQIWKPVPEARHHCQSGAMRFTCISLVHSLHFAEEETEAQFFGRDCNPGTLK